MSISSNEKTLKEQSWFPLLLAFCFKVIQYSIHSVLQQGHCISKTLLQTTQGSQCTSEVSPLSFTTYVCMNNLMYWIRRSLITLTGSPGSPGGPCGPGGPSLPWKERTNTEGQASSSEASVRWRFIPCRVCHGTTVRRWSCSPCHTVYEVSLNSFQFGVDGSLFTLKKSVLSMSSYKLRKTLKSLAILFLKFYYI